MLNGKTTNLSQRLDDIIKLTLVESQTKLRTNQSNPSNQSNHICSGGRHPMAIYQTPHGWASTLTEGRGQALVEAARNSWTEGPFSTHEIATMRSAEIYREFPSQGYSTKTTGEQIGDDWFLYVRIYSSCD